MNWTLPQDPPHVGKPFNLSILLEKSIDLKATLQNAMSNQDYWIQEIVSQNIGSQNQWTVSITYFRSGDLPLPPLPNQKTGSVKILALSALEEIPMDQLEQTLKESPHPTPLPTPWLGLTAVTLLPLLLLSWLVFFVVKCFSKKGRSEAFLKKNYSFKKVSERLQREVLEANSDARQKAFVCSELLRGYSSFCTRFGFLEMTADEIRFRQNQWKHLVPQDFPLADYLEFLRSLELTKYSNLDQHHDPRSEPPFFKAKSFLEHWNALEKR